jgi:hypothetical protein
VLPIRRIASELRRLRWSHILVELLMLIIGILVALAVNGWIEDRADARIERQYLELLVRDLGLDLAVLAEVIAFEERQTADGILAYRALRRGVDVAGREAVSQALSNLISRRTMRLIRATYTDLISTGNIRLISNAALRDRIVGVYETNERALTVRDRNNQAFVDEMYAQYLLESGLVAPRPTSNLPAGVWVGRDFARRLAVPVDTSNDRLWQLDPHGPEWTVLTNKVWYRTLASANATNQARVMVEDIRAAREAIADELARRWPGDQPAKATD